MSLVVQMRYFFILDLPECKSGFEIMKGRNQVIVIIVTIASLWPLRKHVHAIYRDFFSSLKMESFHG